MTIQYFQKGFNYAQDGQGNRLVVHLHGCNMRCPWCANPEGIFPSSTVIKEESLRDFLEFCTSCKAMFFDGGGVTFSGGEPTLQFDSLLFLLKALKESGISTAIETNGTSKRLQELLPYLDYPIIDLKHVDNAKHLSVTGIDNTQILQNILSFAHQHSRLLIRIPIIPHFNDDKNSLLLLIEFLKKLPSSTCVELLCYHAYSKPKWKECNKDYPMPENAKITPARMRQIQKMFKLNGIKIIHT